MKKFLLLCVFAVLFFGCAEERKFVKNPYGGADALVCQADGYITFRTLPYSYLRQHQTERVPFPGFMVIDSDNKVVVDAIIGGQNIQKEIRRDDQIIGINNKAVKNKKQFLELSRSQRFDEISYITFKRFDTQFSLAIRFNEMRMSKLYSSFEKKLLDGKKVGIAIIPSANTSTTNASLNIPGLIENDKNYIGSAYEKMFIDEFASYPEFSVIDRNVLDRVLAEQKFQLGGAVDDATIQKIGKITGASHLFFITMSRYEDSTNYVERLVEVETAKVIHSDNYTYFKPKPKPPKEPEKKEEKKKEEKPVPITININNVNTNVNTNTNTNTNSNINTNTNTNTNK